MWQKAQAELLRAEIEALIAPLSEVTGLYALVREPLTQVRCGLAADSGRDRPWPLLPLMVCEAISGCFEQALPAAAAIQLFKAAGDVFDDVEDADSSESLPARFGSAMSLNAATTLLSLAETAITRLKDKGVEDGITVRVMEAVNSFLTTACAGQHLDLSLPSETACLEETYLKVIGMKSASQVECACHIGALLATADQGLTDEFSAFGHNLGMAAHITNDIQGVTRGSDIQTHKMTLPVIYALAQIDGQARNQLGLAFGKPSETVPDPAQIRDLLFRTGAVHYTTVKMEHYRQQALNNLSEAEKAGASVERLKQLLE